LHTFRCASARRRNLRLDHVFAPLAEAFVALGKNKSSYKQTGAQINQSAEAVLAPGFPRETDRWPSWVHGIFSRAIVRKRTYHKPRDDYPMHVLCSSGESETGEKRRQARGKNNNAWKNKGWSLPQEGSLIGFGSVCFWSNPVIFLCARNKGYETGVSVQ
jgi:hypothetical protein